MVNEKDKSLKEVLLSKKLISSLIGSAAIIASSLLGIPEETIWTIASVIMAHLGIQGIVDFKRESKK